MDVALVAVATPGTDAAEGRVAAERERGGRGSAEDTADRKSGEGVFLLLKITFLLPEVQDSCLLLATCPTVL